MSQSEAAVGPQPRVDSKETKVGAHSLPVAEGPLHPHPLVSQELEHWSAGRALSATCEQSLWVTVCQAPGSLHGQDFENTGGDIDG